jgi:hypothetical protein
MSISRLFLFAISETSESPYTGYKTRMMRPFVAVLRICSLGSQAISLLFELFPHALAPAPEVLGTIAGDDTIFVAPAEDVRPRRLAERIRSLLAR